MKEKVKTDAFVLAQPETSAVPHYAAPPASPIARAEAAPVIPANDPRLDEVAAMMPAEAAETLPITPARPDSSAPTKPRPVSLTIRPRPAATPLRQQSQLEALTAQRVAAGIASGRQGDYAAAELSLRSALALDRGNPTILYNLAVVAERRGDRDSARTLYEATLRQAAQRPDTPVQPSLVTARLDALDIADSGEGQAGE